jgi:hypothetical protein
VNNGRVLIQFHIFSSVKPSLYNLGYMQLYHILIICLIYLISGFKESTEQSVTIQGMKGDAFYLVLEYIYTGKNIVSIDNVENVLHQLTQEISSQDISRFHFVNYQDYEEMSISKTLCNFQHRDFFVRNSR